MNVHIYSDGRHDKDMLRSISHEMVHHAQNCRGDFEGAFEMGEGYAQKSPHLRNMEAEAYLLGNGFLVRDFEDSVKTGDKLVQEWKIENKKIINEQEEPEVPAVSAAEFAEKQSEQMLSSVKTAMKRIMLKSGADIDTIRAVEQKLSVSNRVKLAVTILHLFGIDAAEFQALMGKTKTALGDLEPMNEKNEEKLADKDYDGDGKVEASSEEYLGSKDKAIKKALKKENEIKKVLKKENENIKNHYSKRSENINKELMKKWFKKGDK